MLRYTVERQIYNPSNGKRRVTTTWNVLADGISRFRVETIRAAAGTSNQEGTPSWPVSIDHDVFMVNGGIYQFTYFRHAQGGSEEQPWRYRNAISRYVPYTDYWVGNLSDWQYRFWAAALLLARHMATRRLQLRSRLAVSVPPVLFPYPHVVHRIEIETQSSWQMVKAYDYSGKVCWQRRTASQRTVTQNAKVPPRTRTEIKEGVVFIRTIQGWGDPGTGKGNFYITRQRTIVPAMEVHKTFTLWRGRPVLQTVEMVTERGVTVASLRFDGYHEAGHVDKNMFSLQPPFSYDGTRAKQVARIPSKPPYIEPTPSYYASHPNPAYRQALRRIREVQAPKSSGTEVFLGYKGLLQEQILAFSIVENALLFQTGWSVFP